MDPRRPNALVFICDDLCWGDLSCHGNPVARTPAIDRLRSEGTSCTRWCSGPLCSPARASLMTGHWHLRTRVLDTYCGRSQLDPGERTLGDGFAAAGYATGHFGKWHLGDCHPMRPEDHGFTETLWHRGGGLGQPGNFPENHRRWHRDAYFSPLLLRNGRQVASSGYCTDIFAEAAIGFIEHHAREPFLCHLAFNAPHTPLQVPEVWAEPYRRAGLEDGLARLYGMNACIDANVGRVLETLDRLGLAHDTIVLFTSDHGPCGSAPPRWNAGLRGIKGSVFDGGIRVPAFWRWPGRIAAGGSVPEPTHPVDVLPTLAACCGVPSDPLRPPDGVDLSARLRGGPPLAERSLFMQWHRGDVPVRGRNAAVIAPQFTWVRESEKAAGALFAPDRDPGQQRDLAAELPAAAAALQASYEAWYDRMGASLGAGTFDPPAIALGHPAECCTLLSTQDWRIIGPEGWCRDDLRGEWRVRVETEGLYCLRLGFRAGAPEGRVRLRLGADELEVGEQEGDWWTIRRRLARGPMGIEAWLESAMPWAGLRCGRFLPALYVVAVAKPMTP